MAPGGISDRRVRVRPHSSMDLPKASIIEEQGNPWLLLGCFSWMEATFNVTAERRSLKNVCTPTYLLLIHLTLSSRSGQTYWAKLGLDLARPTCGQRARRHHRGERGEGGEVGEELLNHLVSTFARESPVFCHFVLHPNIVWNTWYQAGIYYTYDKCKCSV